MLFTDTRLPWSFLVCLIALKHLKLTNMVLAEEEKDLIVVRYEDYQGIKMTYNPFVETLLVWLKSLKMLRNKGIIEDEPRVILSKHLSDSTPNGFNQTENDESHGLNLGLEEQRISQRTASSSLLGSSSFPICSRTISGPSAGSPCVFPFHFNTKIFYHCTNEDDFDDPNHALWCSTQTDSQGHHIGGMGYWGECDPRCNYFIFLANMIFDQATENIDCPMDNCVNYNQCNTFVDKMHEIQLTFNTANVYKLSRQVCDKNHYKVCCSQVSEATSNPDVVSTTITSEDIGHEDNLERMDVLSPVILTQNESEIVERNSTLDGRWLPSARKHECSKDISLIAGFIVGGEETKLGEFPHTALLGYDHPEYNDTYYLCGGSLINRRYILTAAHCHDPKSESQTIKEVLIGEWDVSRDPDCDDCRPVQRFRVGKEDVLRHEQWDPDTYSTNGNDIALVRLPEPVVTFFDDSRSLVLPACLDWRLHGENLSSMEEEMKKEFIVTGWGRTTTRRMSNRDFTKHRVLHSRLMQTEVEFLQKAQCQDYKIYRRGLSPNHVCFMGTQNSDSCEGDSGGSIVKRTDSESQMIVQSIVSFGTMECGIGSPGIYTNVRDFIPWIIQNLRE